MLVYDSNFNLFEFSVAIFQKGPIKMQDLH